MVEYKKVKAEIVDNIPKKKSKKKTKFNLSNLFYKFRLGIAIILDLIDFAVCWIPIVNTAVELASMFIIGLFLKNKALALGMVVELIIPAIPFGIIDGILPMCTILVAIDNVIDKGLTPS